MQLYLHPGRGAGRRLHRRAAGRPGARRRPLCAGDLAAASPHEEIAAFAGRPYAEVAAAVLGRFAGDEIDQADLRPMRGEAYATFAHPAVDAARASSTPSLFLLELFHGPTLAFKDVAMQLLARLYEQAWPQRRDG